MIAGRLSKTVAFVAILAALTFGALATASAQSADIKAINKALDTSLRMINSYPSIIRGWILGKGGIENMPYDGFWQLPAKVLWDLGYRPCAQ